MPFDTQISLQKLLTGLIVVATSSVLYLAYGTNINTICTANTKLARSENIARNGFRWNSCPRVSLRCIGVFMKAPSPTAADPF